MSSKWASNNKRYTYVNTLEKKLTTGKKKKQKLDKNALDEKMGETNLH